MRTEAIRAVHVIQTESVGEYYAVGDLVSGGVVTSIEWSITPGLHCNLDTICVLVDGRLYSEHPFVSCQSVYYEQNSDQKESS